MYKVVILNYTIQKNNICAYASVFPDVPCQSDTFTSTHFDKLISAQLSTSNATQWGQLSNPNHRRFYAGKRKGKTPNELFTQEQQALEWMDLLKQKIAI